MEPWWKSGIDHGRMDACPLMTAFQSPASSPYLSLIIYGTAENTFPFQLKCLPPPFPISLCSWHLAGDGVRVVQDVREWKRVCGDLYGWPPATKNLQLLFRLDCQGCYNHKAFLWVLIQFISMKLSYRFGKSFIIQKHSNADYGFVDAHSSNVCVNGCLDDHVPDCSWEAFFCMSSQHCSPVAESLYLDTLSQDLYS